MTGAMSPPSDELHAGRRAYAKRAWREAHSRLSAADDAIPLRGDDLMRLATAAYMVGLMDDFLEAVERAHHAYVDDGDRCAAIRCAFYVGVNLMIRGEAARGSGWFARGQRLLERVGRECAEEGYLLLPVAMQNLFGGNYTDAEAAAAAAVAKGEQFGDADLIALALHIEGQTLIKQARIAEGLSRLDEAMLGVASQDVSPFICGVVYCGVIAGCEEAYDVRRAQEWTEALSKWCEEQPEMVSFTGRCLSHRAGIMQLRGAWREALEEARRARERCEEAMNDAAAGQAFYQQGELHRLQGDFAAAEGAYRDASRCGHEPQPGLCLLRLQQGDNDAAAGAIRRALGETSDRLDRARLLPAASEIALARNDLQQARAAANELLEIADVYDSSMLRAIAAHVDGMVAVAENDAERALPSLRAACATWQELEAPYQLARTRVLVGLACRALGDEDSAQLELGHAASVFQNLGAVPDLARVEMLVAGNLTDTHGLTPRELEVLRLVAAGKTNREIAVSLVVSEHTVARHVQNIFTKLRVTSRSAATAFAFEHRLL